MKTCYHCDSGIRHKSDEVEMDDGAVLHQKCVGAYRAKMLSNQAIKVCGAAAPTGVIVTTVELHHIGISHGLGMTVFVLKEQKMAYIADLVAPDRVLFATVPDFNIKGWLRALSEIERLDFDSAIFSHTQSPKPLGSKKDVTLPREFIGDIQQVIVAEFKKGTNFVNIPDAIDLPKYKHWAMYEEWLPLNAWRIMLEMHMGPYPWLPTGAFDHQTLVH